MVLASQQLEKKPGNILILNKLGNMKKLFRKATSRVWTIEKTNFLKENYTKLSYQDIANSLNLSYAAISHKAFRLKLDSRDLWTEEENNIIKNNYSFNPDVWNLLPNRSRASIIVQARKLGYQRECGNYKINHKFFEEWNPNSAYIIGFFAADGCVEPNLNRISCELSIKDYDHLFNIKNIMNSENPICLKKTRNSCSLYIHNKKMVNDIINKGIIPNKTTRIKLPNVPDQYINDFIRGYIDGDGSIWYNGNSIKLQILGNINFIQEICNKISSLYNINGHIYEHNKSTGTKNCYRLIYNGKKANFLLDNIYYPNCFALIRKQGLARGETPRKNNSAQISQVVSLSNKEPERKTDNQISVQRLNAELLKNNKDDGIVQDKSLNKLL